MISPTQPATLSRARPMRGASAPVSREPSPQRLAEFSKLVAHNRLLNRPEVVLTPHVVPVRSTRAYATLIERAEHRTMPRTGHMGLLTQPSAFADVVSGFAHAHHH